MSSSCCAGNCGCGSGCKCGTSCQGCKMYPDMTYGNASEVFIAGIESHMSYMEGSEMGNVGENDGCKCKCGEKCTCNPCTCK